MRRMLVTPMFSVVAMKSRTFSSVPCSAPEQACGSWEGAQPGSQPRLAEGDVPHQGCHDQFISGGWPGGQEALGSSCFLEFKSSLVWGFELF